MTASISGAGPDVVFVHGSLGDHRQWDSVAEHVRSLYCVVSVSRRYHWPNAAPTRDAHYTYQSHRDDLLQYLHARGRTVHLVGHSYGAGVTLLAALRDPSHVRALVLIEPAFPSLLPTEWPGLDTELASRSAMLLKVQSLADAGHDEEAARALMDWIQGPGGFADLPVPVQNGLLDNAKTVGPTFAHVPPDESCDVLSTLRVPTLVLNGAQTRLYYRLIGERLASCVANGAHARIPGAGHMAIVERPAETAALISSFLAGHGNAAMS